MQKAIDNPSEFILSPAYQFLEEKDAGKKLSGNDGGKYSYTDDTGVVHELMLKRETNSKGQPQPHKVIAEYLGAEIVGALVPEAVPQTYLVSVPEGAKAVPADNKVVPDPVGHEVYLASVYFESNYKSFHTIALNAPDKSRKSGQETVGVTKAQLREYLYDDNKEGKYTKAKYDLYDELIGVSVLINDFDVISTNIGALPLITGYMDAKLYVDQIPGQTHTVRLDFGEGLGKLEDDVHIHSHSRHPFGFGPTNHIREIPRSVKISHHFADALAKICSDGNRKTLRVAIDRGMDNVSRFYGIAPLQAFGRHAGFKEAGKYSNKEELVIQIKGFLNAKMERRMSSLKKLEMEIRTSLSFKRAPGLLPRFKQKEYPTSKPERKTLTQLMAEDPLYYIKGDFHFRKKNQRFNLGVFKYRYASLPKEMLNIAIKHKPEFVRMARAEGRPEILEALVLNKKMNYVVAPGDYEHTVMLCGSKLLRDKDRKLRAIRNHIIEEILLEKSEPHRAKIINRYIRLFEYANHPENYNERDRQILQRTISAAIHNSSIRRLKKTPALTAFYHEQQVLRAANPQPKKHRRRIDPVLQTKWQQLSQGCEPESMLSGLVGNENRLFAGKGKGEKIFEQVLPVPVVSA